VKASEAMTSFSDCEFQQEDGGLPTTVVVGSARGESGVSILNLNFQGGAHFSARPHQHVVWFQMSSAQFDCRIGGQTLQHFAPSRQLSICPNGVDCAADAAEGVDALLVAIDPGYLALAAADGAALDAQLIECFSRFDRRLLELARILALESAADYPNGPLFWNDIANRFIANLVARHTSETESRPRGMLGKDVFKRLEEYVVAHLDEHIEVAALAEIAGRSPFHFWRVFARSVGMTPHRYIVHLRLRRAIELIRDGRSGLAEAAVHTGFADQSHLSRWVRRVHGVSLTQLSA
jgi:AraC family transcriptional regulator